MSVIQNARHLELTRTQLCLTKRRFGVSVESLCGFLDRFGTFVVDCVESLKSEQLQYLLLNLGRSMLNLICGIGSISAERYLKNEAGAAITTVLPHELVKLRGSDLRIIVRTHRHNLLTRWSASKIDRIGSNLKSLLSFIDPRRHSRILWISVIFPWYSRMSGRTLAVAFPCFETNTAAWPPSFQVLLRLRATSPSLSMSIMTFGLRSQTSRWRASYMPINLDCYKLLIQNKTLVCMDYI